MKMPHRDPGSYGMLIQALIKAMSIWGGLEKYLVEVRRNEQALSWVAVLAQVVVSGARG